MVIIKKVGRLQPRDTVFFYAENPQIFKRLKAGEEVEVPNNIASSLIGIEIVKPMELSKPYKKIKRKLKDTKHDDFSIEDKAEIEINNSEAKSKY